MGVQEWHTIGDLLVRAADEAPDRAAVVLPGSRTTYRDLRAGVERVASALLAAGVRRGDRVGMFLPNSAAYLELLLATATIGAVAVPINARFRSVELWHVVPEADLRVLFVSATSDGTSTWADRFTDAFPDLVRGPRPLAAVPSLRSVVMLDGEPQAPFLAYESFLAEGQDVATAELERARAQVRLREPAVIFYTSGTTAAPKGCILSQEALVRQSVATADRLDYRDGDVAFSPLPMFHTGCTQILLAMLHRRGTYVTMSQPEPEGARALIREEGATVLFPAFPPITEGILDTDDVEGLFVGVRSICSVGPEDQLRALQARLPETTRLVNVYGMTEFAGSIVQTPPDAPLDERVTQGRPLPGVEIEIRDPHGEVLPLGDLGEIAARSPTMFDGYVGATGLTTEVIDEDGWFRTGDLGFLDADGNLNFRGRAKDMLKVGGENVAAIEIESHLQNHPEVKTAAVIGVPDPRLGEVPAAFIETVAGAELDEGAVLDHCRGAIASYKVPRYVRFVTSWPMSATKIRKADLHTWFDPNHGTAHRAIGR